MRTRWIAALVALLLVLSGCSGGDAGDSEPGVVGTDTAGGLDRGWPAGDVGDGELDGAGDDEAAADDGEAGDPGAGPVAVGHADGAPMMVRRVEMQVLVEDVSAAATRVRATVLGAGGWVQSEEIVPRTEERAGHGSMVLRVPSADLDGTMTSLAELGEVTFSRSSAEDVTAEYRDVEARVATLEAGAERLRDLIADAPSVESIASLERELTQREADLDALKARRQVLEADVSRSTITVHLAEESEDLVPTASQSGFLVGLRQGWEAFTASVALVLTVAGAVLPFLALALLVALPLLWWRRRRRATAHPATGREASGSAEPAGAGLASADDRPAAAAADPDGPGGRRP